MQDIRVRKHIFADTFTKYFMSILCKLIYYCFTKFLTFNVTFKCDVTTTILQRYINSIRKTLIAQYLNLFFIEAYSLDNYIYHGSPVVTRCK